MWLQIAPNGSGSLLVLARGDAAAAAAEAEAEGKARKNSERDGKLQLHHIHGNEQPGNKNAVALPLCRCRYAAVRQRVQSAAACKGWAKE